jgi:tetratricopeptide (TPR) repeat protein
MILKPVNSALLLILAMYSAVSIGQTVQADSLKRVLSVTKTDTARINLYNKIADTYKESNPDSTRSYAQKAHSLAVKTEYKPGLAASYINKGNAAIIFGDYREALDCFKKAQTEFSELLDNDRDNNVIKSGLARAFASCGVVYSEQGNYLMALENYHKALKLYEETNQQKNISKALNNIGIVYKSQQNYPKALVYLKKAYKIQLALGEQNAPVTLTNIGVIYFETGKLATALDYYTQARELFKRNDNKRGFSLLENYMGDYYARQNDPGLAKEYYLDSAALSEEIQNKFGASLAYYNLGKLYLSQKQYTAALPLANKSLAYANEIGVLDQAYHSEKLLSELYDSMGDPAAALAHYKNYTTAKDSLANQENNKKFMMAEMNFEYKKKEALLLEKNKRQTQFAIFMFIGGMLLIALTLVLYNRRQVKRRLTLQKEVAEYEQKALHLQMNPHFVFNCLSSISSFIVQNGTDSALKYLSKFSKLMRLTLEYSKGSLIPIDKEIESLQNYLELEQLRFHHKFEFTITSSANVEFNMGLPPLLIQPFVENAILHGMVPKQGNGKIDVNFDVENGQFICTITDDGIGLAESKKLKENSVAAHQSMALEITRKRLEIMETATSKSAQIEIRELQNENKNHGTQVTLRLPIQYLQ